MYGAPNFDPGFKTNGCDREAAEFIKARAPLMRAVLLRLIEEQPGTPEELQARLQATSTERVLLSSVRCRASELKRMGEIVHDGTFGRGDSGRCRSTRFRGRLLERTGGRA